MSADAAAAEAAYNEQKGSGSMKSIRTRIILLTAIAIIVAVTAATVVAVIAVKNIGNNNSEQILSLMCETGEKNLDAYFVSVEQSVEYVSRFVHEDLDGTPLDKLADHVDKTREVFEKTAYKTSGVLTYYYRIDPTISDAVRSANPDVSDAVRGFWYTNLDGNGFTEHEVTDITLYDTEDTGALVWFTVPKATGKPIWLPPYITDNLDVRVISYNVPIYRKGDFIGVVGIEIDYSTMAEQVNNIKLFDNGYAFINDAEGTIIYHPRIDVTRLTPENTPKVPEGLLSDNKFINYEFDGVEKQAVWTQLHNGTRLNVSVPVDEINGNWRYMIFMIILISAALLILFIILTLRLAGSIIKPLRKLTEVAEQLDAGNYDAKFDYKERDEVGILANTFNRLITHLKGYVTDMNSLAYGDALTSVRNKGAFDIHIREIQAQMDNPNETEFAVGIFDCDELKKINDLYGHDKGDIYLKNASKLICQVFKSSPVFRIGGDEFAAILRGKDFKNREELTKTFMEQSAEISAQAENPWEQVRVAMGVAVYDPASDTSVDDVIRRADKLMYDNKRERKAERKSAI